MGAGGNLSQPGNAPQGAVGNLPQVPQALGAGGNIDQRIGASGNLLQPNPDAAVADRANLQDDLTLTEEVEKINPDNKLYYKLGRHSKGFRAGKKYNADEESNLENLQKKKATKLYGWVDATKFQEIYYSNAFYNKYINAANEIKVCFELLDRGTQTWYEQLNADGLIDEFAAMGTFDRKKWAAIKKNPKFLDKKNGVNKIYEKDGLFNFLLAWKRVANIHPQLADAKKKDFDKSSLNLKAGSIVLRFSDKVKNQDHRFAAKVEEEVVPADGAGGNIPQPGAAGNLPQVGPGAAGNLPQVGPGAAGNLPQVGPGAGGTLPQAPGGAGGALPQAPGGAGGALPQAPGGAGGVLPQAPGGAGGALPQAPGGAGGALPQAPGGAGGALPQAPGGAGGVLPQAPGGAGGALPQAPGANGNLTQ